MAETIFLSNILCHEDNFLYTITKANISQAKIFFLFTFTKANISQAKAEGKAGEKVTYRREWTSGGGKPEL